MFKSKDNQLIVINSSRSFANELAHKEHIPFWSVRLGGNSSLKKRSVHDADVFISLSEKDTDNYASCILAKKIFNVPRNAFAWSITRRTLSSIRNSASIPSFLRPIFWLNRSKRIIDGILDQDFDP
jgi:hypothetical protein